MRRGAQAARVLNRLYKFTALQSTFSVQCLALVADETGRNQPRLLSLKRALTIFVEHRREVIRRRSEFELAKARARAHILEGLRIALNFLDRVIQIIRGAADADDAKQQLMSELGLSDLQSQAILDMQLRRLAALERQKIEDEYADVQATIAYLVDLLGSPIKILALIRADTTALRDKYGDERRTRIELDARESFADEELIPDKSVLISLTQKGYIKQTPAEAYRAQNRGGRGVSGMATKDEDEVVFLLNARTHDTVLFFSDQGRVYALKGYQLPEVARDAKGVYLTNLISLGEKDRITAMLPISKQMMAELRAKRVQDDEENGLHDASAEVIGDVVDDAVAEASGEAPDNADDVVTEAAVEPINSSANGASQRGPMVAMCTLRGKIKRVDLAAFANIRSSGLMAMTLAEGDELSYVRLTSGDGEVMIVTAQGQALRFSEALVRRMGRTASGVRAMRLKKEGDYIAGMEVVEPGGFLLTVTQKGFGKCTDLTDYTAKGRGGSGMRTMTSELAATGELVAARVVQATDQITIITSDGTALRQRVTDIPVTGRATKGSRLINLRDGDAVASVARLGAVE
jgi:DNA gyrase subunit A